MNIRDIQDEIIEEFELLADDREATLYYLMELGDKMKPLDDKFKTDENLIKGCQSKVWLHPDFIDNKVIFLADSNTDITRGLVSLLVRIFSGQSPDNIINTELDFINKIGMNQIIGSQRSNGFTAMIKQMKLFALGYKTKAGLK